MKKSSVLRAGDWVQVRSREEILATLDKQGQLEGSSVQRGCALAGLVE